MNWASNVHRLLQIGIVGNDFYLALFGIKKQVHRLLQIGIVGNRSVIIAGVVV